LFEQCMDKEYVFPCSVIHLVQFEEDNEKVLVYENKFWIWCYRLTKLIVVDLWHQNPHWVFDRIDLLPRIHKSH
jgi:hypothetical protein